MAIISFSELPRSGSHKIGEPPTLERNFTVYVDSTNQSFAEIITYLGVAHGSPHPEFYSAIVDNVEISESSGDADTGSSIAAYAVNVKATYTIQQRDWDPSPLSRPDIWKFSTQGVAVPALYYFDNTTLKPLTNSAGDYFEGLSVDEGQQKITITGNRATFPSAIASAVTNAVNTSSFLGFAQDCVKVQGISGELLSEVVNEQTVFFWKVTAELLARQTGWNLLIPDVGFNFIEGGVKKRAYVTGPDNDLIASANPVALNGSGGQQPGNTLPAILTRRVYKRIEFSSYFGTPPS
jgi:hypothetical protein